MKARSIDDLYDFVEKKKALPSPLFFHGLYREVKELEKQITELQKKCRAADEVIDFYASNNWNSAKYKDGPVFFAEERGGAAARQFQKDYPKTEITQEEA